MFVPNFQKCLAAVVMMATLVIANPQYQQNPYVPLPVSGSSSGGGYCRERGLCCNGRDSSCVVPLAGATGQQLSQRGSSGLTSGSAPTILTNLINSANSDQSAKECYCDSACIVLGDCCPDYKETCGVRDCIVSDWEPWTECNVSCGIGTTSRSRSVIMNAQNGGKECPDLHQKRACHGQRCEVKDNEKMLRETAIILQSSFGSTRIVDEDQDIRRNLRLNYPKDPLKEGVNEYCALFQVTKSKSKACETLGAEVFGKLREGSLVCVQCQVAAMRRHLHYRCYGHGSVNRSTRWSTLGNSGCNGRWIRQTEQQAQEAGCVCGPNSSVRTNQTETTGTVPLLKEPGIDFIFV